MHSEWKFPFTMHLSFLIHWLNPNLLRHQLVLPSKQLYGKV